MAKKKLLSVGEYFMTGEDKFLNPLQALHYLNLNITITQLYNYALKSNLILTWRSRKVGFMVFDLDLFYILFYEEKYDRMEALLRKKQRSLEEKQEFNALLLEQIREKKRRLNFVANVKNKRKRQPK